MKGWFSTTAPKLNQMYALMKAWVKAREWQKGLSKGQTMAEYALIMAAVAVAVFITYLTMGRDIGSLVEESSIHALSKH